MVENQLQGYEISDVENQMSLLGLKIRSLSFHFDGLLLTLNDFQTQPNAILLTETWLTKEDDLEQLKIDGYQAVE